MAEKGNLFSPGFSSRCAVSPVIAGEGVFILHSFLPVSYTHLDVYKRQDAGRMLSHSVCPAA